MAEEEKETLDADAPGSEGEPGGQAGLVNKILGLFKQNKKIALISIGAILLVVAGLATYFLLKPQDPAEVAAEKQASEENEAESEDVDTEGEQDGAADLADEPVVYKLSPFFLPLMRGNRETGQFVHLSLSFVLSSQKLERDLEKNHAQIREGIYTILKRKKVNDYLRNQKKLEGRLKREIIVLANGLLERGSGTIDGVLFSQFIVK
ncbi:MAG: flagellar basal body-associated protein FliL [Nitrospinales bacterium]